MSADEKESLFDEVENEKREKSHKAIEDIRRKFGDGAIYRAGTKNRIESREQKAESKKQKAGNSKNTNKDKLFQF